MTKMMMLVGMTMIGVCNNDIEGYNGDAEAIHDDGDDDVNANTDNYDNDENDNDHVRFSN